MPHRFTERQVDLEINRRIRINESRQICQDRGLSGHDGRFATDRDRVRKDMAIIADAPRFA